MTWTLINRTEHAKLRLTVEEPLTQEEWDALSASLRAWEPAVVAEGARIVTEMLEDLPRPIQRPSVGGIMPVTDWSEPQKDNTDTFRGPLDNSVMGLRLAVGYVAVVTRSHTDAHVGTMHRWIKHPAMEGDNYGCGHGGCTAHVIVTQEPF